MYICIMKREINPEGWDEITTKKIRIISIVRNFSTNESWVKSHWDGGRLSNLKGRKNCKCCNTSFKKSGSDVALAFTDKGNKVLCQKCVDYFEGEGIKVVINKKWEDEKADN